MIHFSKIALCSLWHQLTGKTEAQQGHVTSHPNLKVFSLQQAAFVVAASPLTSGEQTSSHQIRAECGAGAPEPSVWPQISWDLNMQILIHQVWEEAWAPSFLTIRPFSLKMPVLPVHGPRAQVSAMCKSATHWASFQTETKCTRSFPKLIHGPRGSELTDPWCTLPAEQEWSSCSQRLAPLPQSQNICLESL